LATRTSLITYLKDKGILSVFHYLSLHKSAFYEAKHDGRILPKSDYYTDTLLRLPLFFELTNEQVDMISNEIKSFFNQN
jgi:dTDP-4-amino-4,6-dideoxygalactose transaminase